MEVTLVAHTTMEFAVQMDAIAVRSAFGNQWNPLLYVCTYVDADG